MDVGAARAPAALTIERSTSAWPPALRDAPAAIDRLWIRGQLPTGRAVAVIGARAARRSSVDLARALAAQLARDGATIVSGGALGVDGAAHEGALDASGRTVVVLGTGIDVAYPSRHAALFERVVDGRGAVVSPFPPGTAPARWTFPHRNPIIASLGDVCVVVEAGASSGSLSTARHAARVGRRIVAVVGSVGADRLVADGVATAARGLDEVLALCEGRPLPPRALAPLVGARGRLLESLAAGPAALDDLAATVGLPIGAVLAVAVELELDGLAGRRADGRYVRLA